MQLQGSIVTEAQVQCGVDRQRIADKLVIAFGTEIVRVAERILQVQIFVVPVCGLQGFVDFHQVIAIVVEFIGIQRLDDRLDFDLDDMPSFPGRFDRAFAPIARIVNHCLIPSNTHGTPVIAEGLPAARPAALPLLAPHPTANRFGWASRTAAFS
jgi:hypothetical protein